jgi:hypothetical protein
MYKRSLGGGGENGLEMAMKYGNVHWQDMHKIPTNGMLAHNQNCSSQRRVERRNQIVSPDCSQFQGFASMPVCIALAAAVFLRNLERFRASFRFSVNVRPAS